MYYYTLFHSKGRDGLIGSRGPPGDQGAIVINIGFTFKGNII